MQTSSVGGSSVTEHIAVAVNPPRPAGPFVVMTLTGAIMGRRQTQLQAVAEPIGAAIFVGDVADPGQAQSAVAHAVEWFGGLDVVVANAGGHGFATIAETTDSDWSDACRANLDTAFVLLPQQCRNWCAARARLP